MALNLHAIEQAQLRIQHCVDGVARLKFDFQTDFEYALRLVTCPRHLDGALDVAVATVESALSDGLVTRKELLRPGVDIRAFVEVKSYFPAYVPVVTDPAHYSN